MEDQRYILERINITESGCWIWTRAIASTGYGRTSKRSEPAAHRLAYAVFRGPIPEGMHLDHLCRTRSCCNPDHLEAVTCRTNILRGTSPAASHAQQTHCIHGHEFTESNIYRTRSRPNVRQCRECTKRRMRRQRTRRRQADADEVLPWV